MQSWLVFCEGGGGLFTLSHIYIIMTLGSCFMAFKLCIISINPVSSSLVVRRIHGGWKKACLQVDSSRRPITDDVISAGMLFDLQ